MSKRLNMSNDEAVEWLLSLKNLDICGENRKTAIDKAIQALEAQPKPMEKFDDVKTHIQRLAGDYKCWDNRLTWEEALELNRMLEAQPNSNEFFNFDAPMVKKSDAVSREEVLNGLANIAKAKAKSDAQKALMGRVMFFTEQLPSVTPQKPKGKWIEIEIDAGEFIYKCTKCGMRVINPYKYCPICGAEMGGADETN